MSPSSTVQKLALAFPVRCCARTKAVVRNTHAEPVTFAKLRRNGNASIAACFFVCPAKKAASAKVNVIISKRKRLSIPTKRQLESMVSPAFMFSMKARFEMFFIEIERLFLIRTQVTRQQSPSLHYHHIKTNHLEGVFIARSYHNILMVRIL